jgi:hypothetical protein
MKKYIIFQICLAFSLISYSQEKPVNSYLHIPLIDLDKDSGRQVIVDKEEGQYLGHPTTVLLNDGKTILIVYPKGHGKGEIVYKKSFDGGLTWSERLPVPESWKTSKEVPTVFKVVDPSGKHRLILFSCLYPARMAHSEDEGLTWSDLESAGDWGGIVVMGAMTDLTTGKGRYMSFFHDDKRFFSDNGQELYKEDLKQNKEPEFTLYKTKTEDGGLTWSIPEQILKGRDMHLCEPGILRSPDGEQIAMLLRENSRRFNSQIIFSNDEGETWSDPQPLPNELTGDRHVLKYTPDGRILVVFRDVSPANTRTGLDSIAKQQKEVNVSKVAEETGLGSPTEGDWAGWVGTWDDLVNGNKGQFRIRFKDNYHSWDCCYPGVELLPDGTFVVTTYGYWEKDKAPYILSVRFRINELDNLLKKKLIKSE